jgi:hypothetical protein
MAEAVWLVTQVVGSNVGGGAWVRAIVGVIVGLAVYVGVLALQRDPDIRSLRAVVSG